MVQMDWTKKKMFFLFATVNEWMVCLCSREMRGGNAWMKKLFADKIIIYCSCSWTVERSIRCFWHTVCTQLLPFYIIILFGYRCRRRRRRLCRHLLRSHFTANYFPLCGYLLRHIPLKMRQPSKWIQYTFVWLDSHHVDSLKGTTLLWPSRVLDVFYCSCIAYAATPQFPDLWWWRNRR